MPQLRRMPYSLTACGLIFYHPLGSPYMPFIFFSICLSALVNCLSFYLKITPPD